MAIDLSKILVVAISSRALYDLSGENELYEREGLKVYEAYQREHDNIVLAPGTGFPLIQALLKLNNLIPGRRLAEVVIVSRNNHDTGVRIANSNEHYGLLISRSAFTSGTPVSPYLDAFNVDLFLSAHEEDVVAAAEAGFAAGLLYSAPADHRASLDQIRIAFDGDGVLFSEESERIYQEQGLPAFLKHEHENAKKPLPAGPFAVLLKTLAFLQHELPQDPPPVRTALVTARNAPAHKRVMLTLREWNVRIDETFFMGGVSKDKVLKQFAPHIFFDDHPTHCDSAAKVVPTARVPSKIL